jgi:hypothetical protein
MSWECPKMKKEGGGESHISEDQKNVEVEATEGGQNHYDKESSSKAREENRRLSSTNEVVQDCL